MLTIDLYWSFRSPFCYLVTVPLRAMQKRYQVRINVKPVYPLVLRVPDYFLKADPKFFSYLLLDVARTAEMEGIPFGRPDPDPIVMEKSRKVAAPEQPYIYDITRMAMVAAEEGDAFPLVVAISTLIYAGTVRGWHEGSHLETATTAAGYDYAHLRGAARDNAEALDAQIAQHDADLSAAGHWGVPTMVFQGEPFFGFEKLDTLLWRMKQHGLEER
ncbi:MAG: DsbA family protein [Pseudomonadota bacterium]